MDITIFPHALRGEVTVIPSKSQAHRLLICAAFADKPTQLICADTSRDIEATVDCLRALGAQILRTETGYTVFPAASIPKQVILNCCESGSTLRFMLPIAGALGVDATILMEGRLPHRPLSPLWEELERMGCSLSRPDAHTLRCCGKLKEGNYTIDGGVSSQFITGLLFAHNLIGNCQLNITGKLESRGYVEMTKEVLSLFGNEKRHSPGYVQVEGDWSNGAFWLTAASLGSELSIQGLNPASLQGDRAVVDILELLDAGTPTISAADIPDLVPILAVAAGAKNGAVFRNIRRLRLKESDRVASVVAMITALGGRADTAEDTLAVYGTGYTGGAVDACNDHRIAMSAAIAATVCNAPVTVLGAEAVQKSYPQFWQEYRRLGGKL